MVLCRVDEMPMLLLQFGSTVSRLKRLKVSDYEGFKSLGPITTASFGLR